MDVTNMFSQYIGPLQTMNAKEDELMKMYVKGLREFKSDKFFYRTPILHCGLLMAR